MARRIPAKKVLELLSQGLSFREIGRVRGISPRSVSAVESSARAKGITWDSVRDMGDEQVYFLVFPERAEVQVEPGTADVDWDYVHSELQRAGVTLKLLWEEHADRARAQGLTPRSYVTFCRGYGSYVSSRRVTNHLEHKPGQVMEVDWSGTAMTIVDAFTGEVSKARLFVATLPYSMYTYVEATADMKQEAWIKCHVHAWDFFGGVAVRTVPDNLKTGVIEHPREGEIVLNRTYEALGAHYGTAIMPTGVRKPKQKASVEGTVGKIATAVVARLRDRTFHTVDELNAAIAPLLEEFNAQPFQKRDGSRTSVFEDVEREFLGPLPRTPFEFCQWVYGRKVALDFHVAFEKNRYSCPHALVGRKVDLRVSDTTVEVFAGGERVASHVRFDRHVQYQYRTDKSHMPPEFLKPEWDDERIRGWARSIGPSTLAVVTRILDSVPIKEQGYNPSLAVLNLSKRYGDRRLEDACAYALARASAPRCRFIRTVLASGVADGHAGGGKGGGDGGGKGGGDGGGGGYIRGAGYYQGGGS